MSAALANDDADVRDELAQTGAIALWRLAASPVRREMPGYVRRALYNSMVD